MRYLTLVVAIAVLLSATAAMAGTTTFTAADHSVMLSNDYLFSTIGIRQWEPYLDTRDSNGNIARVDMYEDTGIMSLNAQAVGTNYTDAGVVLYFNGGLKLGDLQSVSVTSTGTVAPSVNLWLDSGGDNAFFSWTARAPSYLGPNGDSYCGHDGNVDLTSSFYMLGGNGAGTTHTLAELQSGAVGGIGANTPVALWIGITDCNMVKISSIKVSTVPEPGTLVALMSGMVGFFAVRRRRS